MTGLFCCFSHGNCCFTVQNVVHKNLRFLHSRKDTFAGPLRIVHHQHPCNPLFFPETAAVRLFIDIEFQFHSKNRTFSLLAFHRDIAAHQIHQIFCNRHPKACTLDLVDGLVLFSCKRAENLFDIFRTHPVTIVRHFDSISCQLCRVLRQLLQCQ